jgi:hypothetical protein
MDPDPDQGGPKTRGFGFGSGTLVKSKSNESLLKSADFFFYENKGLNVFGTFYFNGALIS